MKQISKNPFATPALMLAALFLLYVIGKVLIQGASKMILLVILVMSVITFAMYGKDKFAATRDRWRISENALHIGSLLGGWPGAALGQVMFRHKSSKLSFKGVYWATVAANIIVVASIFL